ncbi:MAG: DUF6675 family protein [Woeseia sp.]
MNMLTIVLLAAAFGGASAQEVDYAGADGNGGCHVLARDLPVPPCEGQPYPAASAVGDSLNQLVLIDEEVPERWTPPPCTGWSAGPTQALQATAGRFRMAGDTDALAAHLARVSRMTGIVYWSTTREQWRPLFDKAFALARPDPNARRTDFTTGDVVPGAELHSLLKENNPTEGVVFRTTVHERTPDQLVFETVNVTAIKVKLLLFTLEIAGPEEFRQLYFVKREQDDVWRFYNLNRMGQARTLAGSSAANYRNRAEAYFRYLAGLDMTREPPASR